MGIKIQENLKELYEKDFVEWVDKNIELLKNKEYSLVDWENLLEEIQDMGNRHLEAVISYLAIILEHMYKLDNFKKDEKAGRGWIKSILNSRDRINVLFKRYPSLKSKLPNHLQEAWEDATLNTVVWLRDNDLNPDNFNIPKECPYTYEEAMNKPFKLFD
ncbi:MAG: DUF29 domain-containing protein [Hydrogenobaculum sp.]|nr:MAG: DUF29 domain-containing protein [Hydrogenobaculum sp.]HEK25052.1 DUF29 domain-containing protein [Hydrogenobaculum sp.]